MQVVATGQSSDVEAQQPPTHVPLAVVNKHESVTAQAYGYASLLVSTQLGDEKICPPLS